MFLSPTATGATRIDPAAGVDLPTVAALLGHSRLDTVRLYSQPGADELQRAAARLEEG